MQGGEEGCEGLVVPCLGAELAEEGGLDVGEETAEAVVAVGVEVGGGEVGGVEEVVGIELEGLFGELDEDVVYGVFE